ncbi:MAG: restriction system-associated AAA family ATPase [Desulfobulbaceae bacterium]|nr:restriction system-associated AAA family ATPase [Desulfobulbaceae bacterium]
MKLLRVHIIAAKTCGGLLDGMDIWFRSPTVEPTSFEPLCLVGPNGAGKSQFLQVVAEIFQSIFHATVDKEERQEGNSHLQFEIEYLIRPKDGNQAVHVRATRLAQGKRKHGVVISKKLNGEWIECDLQAPATLTLLPLKIVGYTSGDNETLSLPFLLSRSGYADEVGRRALEEHADLEAVPDTRLMLIDYGTHLEVLVANLLLGTDDARAALLQEARQDNIHSFRCIVQLAHRVISKVPRRRQSVTARKGIQLTAELEKYLDQLRRCSTCYHHEERTDTYIFDFLVDEQTTLAFRHFWSSALDLYVAFHKLAMLNDLAIPRTTRNRFKKETQLRRFASRLPEPQDEDKVFRFERVAFNASDSKEIVDYVSLSDGEHQLVQLLGTLCMVSFPGVLFLLDEPESHFNPQWRVKFTSRLLDLPTIDGKRREKESDVSQQDCLLTTHAPFIASDTPRDRVFIFRKDLDDGKVKVKRPDIETYGTTFDSILEECFDVRPPISQIPREEIAELMESDDPGTIKMGIQRLGQSVEKVFLADRLRQVMKKDEA